MNWNLKYYFKDDNEFEQTFSEIAPLLDEIEKYKGLLHLEEKFIEYLNLRALIEKKIDKVYEYALQKSDLDKRNLANQNHYSRCFNLYMKYIQIISFEDPEILTIGNEKIFAFIDKNKQFAHYQFPFEKLFKQAEHVLDEKAEYIIANYEAITNNTTALYSALTISDNKTKSVSFKNGETVKVTQGNYANLIAESGDEEERKEIFEAIFKNYDEHKNILAEIYTTVLKTNKTKAKIRNYNTILESYLHKNNIPVEVYYNLVDVASNNTKSIKKYIELVKRTLNLKKYHTYDRFLELSRSFEKYDYNDAKNIFFDAIKEFPEEYQKYARMALEDGFVDVDEKEGKRPGAYSTSISDCRPFILLNYDKSLKEVFTIAHEAGHSIHSLFANDHQPALLQNYTIFVAEIASTFNEHVLLDHFLKSPNTTKGVKITLLQRAINNIISTFYRQTLFAEYELEAHKLIEADKPINHEILSGIMIGLYKKYYGIDIKEEKFKEYVWAYIPHLFRTPFYVYQYATSFAASFKIYKDVTNNEKGAFERFIGLLKSGGSKYPVEQAKEAGVDFLEKETFFAVVERLDELVGELEKALTEGL